MTRAKKYGNLGAIVLGFAAFGGAGYFSWNGFLTPFDLSLALAMYVATGLGITVGYHRLLTHRAFRTSRPVECMLAVLGSMAVEGPVIEWVSDHRKHHASADRVGDPHSPHVGYSNGLAGVFRGFVHAHMGWVVRTQGEASPTRFSRDLLADPMLCWIDRAFPLLALVSLAIPFAAGYAVSGTLRGGLTTLFWAGLVRIAFVHHVTFSINSVGHLFGRRRFNTDDESRNCLWLALPTFGESWHHNHHAFPQSAFHGLEWWELDPSAWVIRAMRRLKLAWSVVEISPARQQAGVNRHRPVRQ